MDNYTLYVPSSLHLSAPLTNEQAAKLLPTLHEIFNGNISCVKNDTMLSIASVIETLNFPGTLEKMDDFFRKYNFYYIDFNGNQNYIRWKYDGRGECLTTFFFSEGSPIGNINYELKPSDAYHIIVFIGLDMIRIIEKNTDKELITIYGVS